MYVEIIDGVRVLKLNDRAHRRAATDDTLTTVHIWRLLTGAQSLRDNSVGPRRFL
ncbi:hypothetical protein ACEN2J_08240 [Pseudorhodobacter sp. W20_MBD10_FR17]|uniref:hypothetical protein n=1 Tax=Pseudorhodobacter sp. W20_MBD10_FR17 TaxID=3240266 RepID=UPI003F9CAA54